MSDKRNLVLR